MKYFAAISCLFIFHLFNSFAFAQFYFIEDVNDQIQINFLKKKIETEVNKTFFNVLQIKNPTNRSITFQTNFSYPAEWTFMGEKNQQITLDPNDSILIPFRAATAIDTKGEIGYSIVATLADMNGKSFKNEYSFVNIPKIKNIKINPIKRVEYFNQNTNSALVQLLVANNGNTDENFNFEFKFDPTLSTEGMNDLMVRNEFSLPPYSDTILSIPVFLDLKRNYYNTKFHKISIKTVTVDTTINRLVWLKQLDASYLNPIPDNYKMLTVEINASNVFSDYDPTYQALVFGNLLFKNDHTLRYSFNYYGNNFTADELSRARFLVEYSRKKLLIQVGDISPKLEQNLYGKGGSVKYLIKNNEIYLASTYSKYNEKIGYGGSFYTTQKKLNVGVGYSIIETKSLSLKSQLGFISIGSNLNKIGNVDLKIGASITDNNIDTFNGYGGSFNYHNKFNRTILSINADYGNSLYTGTFKGRTRINGQLFHPINDKSSISSYYNYSLLGPQENFISTVAYRNSISEQLEINYSNLIKPSLMLSVGPITQHLSQTQIFQGSAPFDFTTRNAGLKISSRIRGVNSDKTLNLSLQGSYNFVTDYSQVVFDTLTTNSQWFNFILSVNFRSRIWGAYASYYNGPYSINQQYSYFAYNYYSKNIRIFPYIELQIVPKYLYLSSKLNYTYDISGKTNRVNFINEFYGYPINNLKISFLSTINYQANKDILTDEKFSYANTYFELRLRKEFDINQPKYQYHDLKVHFFKDLNGNSIKDKDEPGIQNILFSINMDDKQLMEGYEYGKNYFMANELLSDIHGVVEYTNIPNGFYVIDYQAVSDDKDAFTSFETHQAIFIGKDETLYIPFVENNKIFGKAILNRSKLSNLGAIDPSNIKVTAEDSYGKKYSALTDAAGNFNIYVPSVDKYKVKINNIFFENFELEQNDYEVQLNGYRQFEVNFIFNEKKRKISFTAAYDYGSRLDGPGVEIVRRTNLSGTVKDATTLQAIVSKIRVVDAQGKEITSANSSAASGIFTLSFVAGDDYTVEVNSDDYWFYAEKLYSQQIVTFSNLRKEILLKAITVGALIPMNTLNFEPGKTEIPPTSFPELERLLKVLKKNPTVKISVHGHADDMEIQGTQDDIALKRAEQVAKYLIANGCNRIKYAGHANSNPIADNDTEDGRKQNRRVEIIVTGK